MVKLEAIKLSLPVKAIIIDDEPKIVSTISSLVGEHFADLEIVSTANDMATGLRAISEYDPDILILDINLPDGTGFDLLKQVDLPRFKLIFITAYEEYAIRAFKYSAIDYLVKPIQPNELIEAINRAKNLKQKEDQQLKLSALLENLNEGNSMKKIVLRTADNIHLVKTEDIIRCESDSNYTFFYLTDGRKILVSRTMKEFAELLKSAGFLRVHQSHLININHIDRYAKADGGAMIMKDNSSVPISHERKSYILKHLESLL
ncbi:MAG: LytTR family DNA-binding domain-containing protein [Bacteroidales bacterium]|jgi:two-component system LytT family response regulator